MGPELRANHQGDGASRGVAPRVHRQTGPLPGHHEVVAAVRHQHLGDAQGQEPPDVVGDGALQGEHRAHAGHPGDLGDLPDDGGGVLGNLHRPSAGSELPVPDAVGLELLGKAHRGNPSLLVQLLGRGYSEHHVLHVEVERPGLAFQTSGHANLPALRGKATCHQGRLLGTSRDAIDPRGGPSMLDQHRDAQRTASAMRPPPSTSSPA